MSGRLCNAHFFFFIFRLVEYAAATAWLAGLPLATISLTFFLNAFLDFPLASGMLDFFLSRGHVRKPIALDLLPQRDPKGFASVLSPEVPVGGERAGRAFRTAPNRYKAM